MNQREGTGNEIKSPETVRYQRRARLPGVELRTVYDSSCCYWFYSPGFEFFVPVTWRGEVWHPRGKEVLEPGSVMTAHPGDLFASQSVLSAGSWKSLTIDAGLVAELGGKGVAWDRVRLRPFARLSQELAGHFAAIERSLQTAPMDIVVANLRGFLAGVANELVEVASQAPGAGAPALPSRAAERFACFRSEPPVSVPVAELASEIGRSRFQAMREFKRRFGLPPHAYQLCVRLGVAQKSLREGDSPAQVAAELGFVDQSHFTRHFKRFAGVTPARYVRDIIPTPTRPKTAQRDSCALLARVPRPTRP